MPDSTTTDILLGQIEELKLENLQLKAQLPSVLGQVEAMMDHSPATAWIKNSKGALLYINATFQEFIDQGEFPVREWYGKTDDEIWDPEMAKMARETDLKVLDSGLPDSFFIDIKHSDGAHHWLAHKFRLTDSYGEYCVGCISFDLTEHIHASGLMDEALATLQEATRRKVDFFSQVNKDLAAPLFSILASADQWNAAGEEDEKSKQGFVDHISFGAAKLRSQVDNLMLLAETDNPTLKLDIISFDCRSLVDKVVRNTQRLLVPGVDFSVEVDETVPLLCVADAAMIEHLMRCVLEHACNHTALGYVRLLVDWDSVESHLLVHVDDSSIGLTRVQQQHMFTDVLAMNENVISGAGAAGASIGLTICYRLSALLDADLRIESEFGSGLQVQLSIPANVPSKAPNKQDTYIPFSESMLIVGNSPDNTELLKNIVVSLGNQVDCVDSGEQAFAALQKQSYKLIFMNIDMPVMDGITAVRWIRRRGIETPIVAIVSDITADERRRYISWGITDFLKNPESRTDVFRVIERRVRPLR